MSWSKALFEPRGVAGTPSSTGCAQFVQFTELLSCEESYVLV